MSPLGTRRLPSLRVSLQFKLTFPILILASLMLFWIFSITSDKVHRSALAYHRERLLVLGRTFAEIVKEPLLAKDTGTLAAKVQWIASQHGVLEVRVEGRRGRILGESIPGSERISPLGTAGRFLGTRDVGGDMDVVAVPIQHEGKTAARLVILFSRGMFEAKLQSILEESLWSAFGMVLLLSFLMAIIAWLAIRPLFSLKHAAHEILAGDLSARARVYSFDEIADLGEAFNEMVARLTRSLDNLRARTEALEESEEKYRLLVENARDIIFTLDHEGRLVLLNRGFSGSDRETLFAGGLSAFLELHDEPSRAEFEKAIAAVRAQRRPITNVATTHVHRETRQPVHYLTHLTPAFDPDGRVKLIHGIMRDMTEFRRLEMMKESLIRDVAHELKTPTAKFEMAVSWFEHEIRTKADAEKFRPIIQLLKTNTDRLMRTITDIMDLSKLESGLQRIAEKEIDLREVLQQVIADMEPLCGKKGLSLRGRLASAPLLMRGDRDMLYRLFLNLVGNAVKFTEKGGITIEAHALDDRIHVTVEDTGIGIAKEDLAVIFGRFMQKTPASEGIGVGLAISRNIATLHHGKIWAESRGPGQGSAFQVEFPGDRITR